MPCVTDSQCICVSAADFDGVVDDPFCGGALITDSHVLTAAHCMFGPYGNRDDPSKIRVGEHDFRCDGDTDEQTINVASVVVHENYHDNSSGLFNDIAIIKLETSVR